MKLLLTGPGGCRRDHAHGSGYAAVPAYRRLTVRGKNGDAKGGKDEVEGYWSPWW